MNSPEATEALRCSAWLGDVWCLRMKPIRNNRNVENDLKFLANGPGTGMRALMWTAKAMCGLGDQREEKYETRNQRLAIWTNRKLALKAAREHNRINPYWRAIPQRVLVVA